MMRNKDIQILIVPALDAGIFFFENAAMAVSGIAVWLRTWELA